MDACPCEVRGRHPEAFLCVRILTPQRQAIGHEVESLPVLDYLKTCYYPSPSLLSRLEAVPTFKENQCDFHIQVKRSTRLSQTCNLKFIIAVTIIAAGTASSPDVVLLHLLSH